MTGEAYSDNGPVSQPDINALLIHTRGLESFPIDPELTRPGVNVLAQPAFAEVLEGEFKPSAEMAAIIRRQRESLPRPPIKHRQGDVTERRQSPHRRTGPPLSPPKKPKGEK